MIIERALNSCGIKVVEGIGSLTPIKIITEIAERGEMRCAYFTFSAPIGFKNTDDEGTLKALKQFIRTENLGKVTSVSPRLNKNSGNVIGFLIWHYDWELLAEWAKKNKVSDFELIGKKYRVLADTCSHGAQIGSIITYQSKYSGYIDRFYFAEGAGNFIKMSEVEEVNE